MACRTGMLRLQAVFTWIRLDNWRKRGAIENNTIYSRFLRANQQGCRVDRARLPGSDAQVDHGEARKRYVTHIKKDESGKVILTEIHSETLPPGHQGRDVVA